MLNCFQIFEKAAVIAAFSFFTVYSVNSAGAAVVSKSLSVKQQGLKLDQAKKKITSLLLLKQRSQALEILQELSLSLPQPDFQKKIAQLKLVVLSSFLSTESQDFFEQAASQYLNQNKVALKNAQKCLASDPDHILCLWAETKALPNNKTSSRYLMFSEKMRLLALEIPELRPLVLSVDKKQPEFLNLKLDANKKTDLYDSQILSYILEFDRSILAKNYLLAKETLTKLQQAAPDYVDIVIMKAQLERHTYEDESADNLSGIVSIYKKKCEAVSPGVARKYFFDIDFCKRTLE